MFEVTDPKLEFVNHCGATSVYALGILRKLGRLEDMKLLSLGCLMPHLADYLALFHTVHHNTMIHAHLPCLAEDFSARYVEHLQDFFTLPSLEVDCVISHTVLHCLNDSRYGNNATPDGWHKSYAAAGKLREIVSDKKIPAIISISVNREELFLDNNSHLSHDKFVDSFIKAGFTLKDHFFDYCCGGIAQRPEYLETRFRRAKELPTQTAPREWVVGTYYFD